MKALIVAAHPDDSFIFAANMMQFLKQKGYEVDDLCVTHGPETARGREFTEAAAAQGVNPIHLGLPDDPYEALKFPDFDFAPYDVVVTHGSNGEYGHPHHKQVHQWVSKNLLGRGKTMYCFAHNVPRCDVQINGYGKLSSQVLQIYEREAYIMYNFNLPFEHFYINMWGAQWPTKGRRNIWLD